MSKEKKIFAVETITTFFEVHLVEAEDEETAKKIAEHSDYNVSKHVGTQNVNVYKFKEKDINRFVKLDEYFFQGYASLDDDSQLIYKKMDGTLNGNMPVIKIDL
jgi:hypothetical protein